MLSDLLAPSLYLVAVLIAGGLVISRLRKALRAG